jgi:hypothetical protein
VKLCRSRGHHNNKRGGHDHQCNDNLSDHDRTSLSRKRLYYFFSAMLAFSWAFSSLLQGGVILLARA